MGFGRYRGGSSGLNNSSMVGLEVTMKTETSASLHGVSGRGMVSMVEADCAPSGTASCTKFTGSIEDVGAVEVWTKLTGLSAGPGVLGAGLPLLGHSLLQ